jgi:predicted membrane protein DUF2085
MLQQLTHSPRLPNTTRPLIWAERLLVAVLAVLFVGPLLAPLFQATRLPIIGGTGALARDLLSYYICPTPARSYALVGFPMAVCARCWGATIGLWAAWLVCRPQLACRSQNRTENHPEGTRLRAGNYPLTGYWFPAFGYWLFQWPWVLRLCFALAALLLWNLEINFWPAAPLPALILNGANGGFWIAMAAGSLWHAVRSTATQRAGMAES